MSTQLTTGSGSGTSDEESPRQRAQELPPAPTAPASRAPPSKPAETECLDLDDVGLMSGGEEDDDLGEETSGSAAEDKMDARDGVPEAVLIDSPSSCRTSMSSDALEPKKLKVPEQHGKMEPVARNRKNKKPKDEDTKAFLSSDDEDEYDPQIYKARRGGSMPHYDSDYADNYYNEEDWNPWSCENILVGVQLFCCLIVVIAALAAMIIPLFAHKLNPEMRLAVQSGDIEVVRLLLNNGTATHVDASGSRDMTALHWASLRGQPEIAGLLLDSRASSEKMSASGLKPIHYAVRSGHKSVVEALLEYEADSNATDNNGWTPLHWAGMWGRADIARMLISNHHPANPTVLCQDHAHKTALSLAQSNGHSALIRILDKAMEAYVERVNASLLLQLNSTG